MRRARRTNGGTSGAKAAAMGLALTLALAGQLAPGAAEASQAVVKVKGMVCAFCAQGIKKKLSAEGAVKSVDVSLQDRQVKVVFNPGKDLPDPQLTRILEDAGYNVSGIERSATP